MIRHTHLITEIRKPSRYSFQDSDKIAICNEDSFIESYTDNIKHVTCPKCSAAWGKAEIKRLSKEGRGTITLVRDEDKGRSYRSSYKVLVDGVHRANVTLNSGKRQLWVLRNHDFDALGFDEELKSKRVVRRETLSHQCSKEHMATYVLDHFDFFIPYEEFITIRQAENAEYAKRVAARAAEREDDKNATREAMEVLEEMLRKPAGFLSNLEINAINVSLNTMKLALGFM